MRTQLLIYILWMTRKRQRTPISGVWCSKQPQERKTWEKEKNGQNHEVWTETNNPLSKKCLICNVLSSQSQGGTKSNLYGIFLSFLQITTSLGPASLLQCWVCCPASNGSQRDCHGGRWDMVWASWKWEISVMRPLCFTAHWMPFPILLLAI